MDTIQHKKQSDIAFVTEYLEIAFKRKLKPGELRAVVRTNYRMLELLADAIRAYD